MHSVPLLGYVMVVTIDLLLVTCSRATSEWLTKCVQLRMECVRRETTRGCMRSLQALYQKLVAKLRELPYSALDVACTAW